MPVLPERLPKTLIPNLVIQRDKYRDLNITAIDFTQKFSVPTGTTPDAQGFYLNQTFGTYTEGSQSFFVGVEIAIMTTALNEGIVVSILAKEDGDYKTTTTTGIVYSKVICKQTGYANYEKYFPYGYILQQNQKIIGKIHSNIQPPYDLYVYYTIHLLKIGV